MFSNVASLEVEIKSLREIREMVKALLKLSLSSLIIILFILTLSSNPFLIEKNFEAKSLSSFSSEMRASPECVILDYMYMYGKVLFC